MGSLTNDTIVGCLNNGVSPSIDNQYLIST